MIMKRTSKGIGFIEVMTATVIISIACVGLMMGVVHARSELHSLEIKERATEELLNYMEYWKGRIADGIYLPMSLAEIWTEMRYFWLGDLVRKIL